MKRRNVLKAGAAPAATLSLATPALAQTRPKVSWRLTSSFPRTLDTLHGAAAQFSRLVGEATDGDFSVRVFSPGEIVPALEAREATSKGWSSAASPPRPTPSGPTPPSCSARCCCSA